MLATVVCAVLCGARGFDAIAQWINLQLPDLWYTLGYFRRPPTANAFRYLLNKLEPEILEACLRDWIAEQGQAGDLQVLALDGKTLCGTLGEHGRSVHLLSLFDQHTGCVLSQLKVSEKTNEAKAALEILKTVALRGRVITGDAMFCQRELCEAIVEAGGDYLIVVKDNQKTLKESIAGDFISGFSPLQRAEEAIALICCPLHLERTRSSRAAASRSQYADCPAS